MGWVDEGLTARIHQTVLILSPRKKERERRMTQIIDSVQAQSATNEPPISSFLRSSGNKIRRSCGDEERNRLFTHEKFAQYTKDRSMSK